MATTDIAALILSFFFLIRGASRGFMNSLTAPFSIIAATVLSIVYYQHTKDMLASLIIGLIGPLLISLLIKFLLKTLSLSSSTEIKLSFLSRLSGSVLTLIWGWVFVAFALILLTVLPPWGKALTDTRADVLRSNSYAMVKPLSGLLFADSKQNAPAATKESAAADAQSLADDPRFQAILQDPEIQQEINAHDIVKLMSNPKMMAFTQQMMNDPATMKKIFALYKSQTETPVIKNP